MRVVPISVQNSSFVIGEIYKNIDFIKIDELSDYYSNNQKICPNCSVNKHCIEIGNCQNKSKYIIELVAIERNFINDIKSINNDIFAYLLNKQIIS